MADEEIPDEYARLRTAAVEVLDAAPDAGGSSARLDAALRELRSALSGGARAEPDPGPRRPTLDPFEHALAMVRYEDRDAYAIPLPQRASELQRWLDGDRTLDEPRPDRSLENVVITQLRAMIAADLLEELAARLSPGAAFGPGRGGEDLARVATDLAKELLAQTFVGE